MKTPSLLHLPSSLAVATMGATLLAFYYRRYFRTVHGIVESDVLSRCSLDAALALFVDCDTLRLVDCALDARVLVSGRRL